ncbi:MAG: hypothetical protein ACI9OB_000356 [Nonlabens sp.]|jgi:hypothetical protein
MSTPISRRTLLRVSGGSTLAVLLAACSAGEPTGDATPDAATPDAATGLPANGDITQQALDAAGLTTAPTLTPIVATYEVLTGAGRVPLGILGPDQRPILDADVRVWVVKEGELVDGPITPLFHGEGLGDRGIYIADVALTTTGLHDLVVEVDGDATGTTTIAVVDPSSSVTFPPGATFPSLGSPTADNPGLLETICTQDPACTMHEASLDAALAAGAVVLTVATPAFCQTAVCGPVVSVIEGVRDSVTRDDVTFIHVEVYNDAGVTTTDLVNELGLPTEPWTWVIAADGTVVDRFDGPVVPDLLTDALNTL